MVENLIGIIAEEALKESQKGAAIVVSKLGFTVAAAFGGKMLVDWMNSKSVPISSLPEEDQQSAINKRIFKNAAATAGCSVLGGVAHGVVRNIIEASDVNLI